MASEVRVWVGRLWLLSLLVAAVLAGGVVGSARASGPCGTQATPPSGGYQHVVWILMENHAYGQIVGSSAAPFENQLANECGLATNYMAITHPSLPNYIALTSGDTQGITDDNDPSSHPLSVPSIFSQLPAGGSRSLEESMPANCSMSDSGEYAVRHNPETYYTNLGTDCANYDVPLGSTPDLSARFTFVTPNLLDDMHDGTVQEGDTWLQSFMGEVFSTPQWQAGTTAVFITFDEDDGSTPNQVYTAVVAPSVPAGTQSAAAFNHYSLLRTAEDLLGLPPIANAATATGMETAFNLGASGTGATNATRTLITRKLLEQLVPAPKAARLAPVLGAGGYHLGFSAPRAGRITINWYYVPRPGRTGKAPAKRILVATGTADPSRPGRDGITIKLTRMGRQLLKRLKTLRLTANGVYNLRHQPTVFAARSFVLSR